MSSSSNINCCVFFCNQGGTVDANGKRVGFFIFPKDPNLRAQWLQKIRRDVGTKFKLTEITNVCSLHFRESEIEIEKGLVKAKSKKASFVSCELGVGATATCPNRAVNRAYRNPPPSVTDLIGLTFCVVVQRLICFL